MDLNNILSSNVIAEANSVIKLQHLLLGINESNFESTFLKIIASIFVKSKERINQLAHNILTMLDNTTDMCDIFASLVVNLYNEISKNIREHFKKYFIHNFIHKLEYGKLKKLCNSSFARHKFIRLCCEKNFIEISDIINEIKYCCEYLSHLQYTQFGLLMWFADYIKQDNDLFQKMKKEVESMIKKDFPQNALTAYHEFQRMDQQNQNFEDLIFMTKNFYAPNSILYYIKNDMLDEFCSYNAEKITFDYLELVEVSFYEPHRIFNKPISLLCFAAFYGSIKIFKHLIGEFRFHNLEVFTNEWKSNKLTYCAVSGGNNEIIRIVFEENERASKSPKYAALFYQNQIFEWLQNNQTSDQSTAMHFSCKSNNVEILLETLKQSFDVTKIHKNFAPIHYASLNGHLDCMRILLSLSEVDVNCVTSNKFTPLHLAVLSKNIEAVRFLLEQPNININCQLQGSYHTPLHLAVRESEEEIIKLLLEDRRIIITVGNFVLFIYFFFILEVLIFVLTNSITFCC